ncbi:MAG: PAS domain S-box protein [Ignavibacteriaceae bacterium]|nr:PAS domain S-box protein [Ignavibacteriaceae bacterium]
MGLQIKLPAGLKFTFFTISAILLLVSLLIFSFQHERLKTSYYEVITKRASLQIVALQSWIDERTSESRYFLRNQFIKNSLEKIVAGNRNPLIFSEYEELTLPVLSNHDYVLTEIYDAGFNKIYSNIFFEGYEGSEEESVRIFAAKNHDFGYSNLFILNGVLTIDLILRVRTQGGKVGFLLNRAIIDKDQFEKNAAYFLKKTAETYFLISSSDSLYLLSINARYESDFEVYPLNSIINKETLTYKSLRTNAGYFEGINPKGEKVFGDIQSIPELNLRVVNIIPMNEVFVELLMRDSWVFLLSFFLIGLSFVYIQLYMKKEQLSRAEEIIKLEKEKEAITKYFKSLEKFTNDIFFLIDTNGNIIEANDRATTLYGYSNSEFKKLNFYNLGVNAASNFAISSKISTKEGLIYVSEHITRDSKIVSVEASVRSIVVDADTFFQIVIRDVSEKTAALKQVVKKESILLNLLNLSDTIGWEYNSKTNAFHFTGSTQSLSFLHTKSNINLEGFLEFFEKDEVERLAKCFSELLSSDIEFSGTFKTSKIYNNLRLIIKGFYLVDVTQSKTFIGYIKNNTAESLLLEELIKKNSFLETTQLTAKVASWEYSTEPITFNYSSNFKDLYEITSDENLTSEYLLTTYYSEPYQKILRDSFNDAIKTGSSSVEVQTVPINGKTKWFRVGINVTLKDGVPVRIIGATQDITDEKEAQVNLVRNERLYRKLAERFPKGIIALISSDLRFTLIDGEFVEKFRVPGIDFEGAKLQEVTDPQLLSATFPLILNAFKGEQGSVEFEFSEDEIYLFQIAPMYNEMNTEVEHAIITALDITEMKKSELQLKKERDKVRLYFDNTQTIYVILDTDGNIVEINRKGLELLKRNREDVIGKNLMFNFYTEDTAEESFKHFKKYISGEIEMPPYVIRKLKTATGDVRTISWVVKLIKDGSGKVISALGSAEDITNIVRVSQALEESENKYKRLVDSLNEIVFFSNINGKVEYISNYVEKFSGFKSENILGAQFTAFIYEEDIPLVVDQIKKVIRNEDVSFEIRLKTFWGPKWVIASLSRIMDNGKITGISGVLTDIHAIKVAEAKILKLLKYYTVTSNLNNALSKAIDFEDLYSAVKVVLYEYANYQGVILYKHSVEKSLMLPVASKFSHEIKNCEELISGITNTQNETGIFIKAAVNKKIGVYQKNYSVFLSKWQYNMYKSGIKDFAVVPVYYDETIWGSLLVFSSISDFFDEDESKLLSEIASDISQAVKLILSEQKRLEIYEELIQNESKYHSLFENSGDAILVIKGNQIYDCNNAATQMFMSDKGLIEGNPVYSLVPHNRKDLELIINDAIKKCIAGKKASVELECVRSNGEHFLASADFNMVSVNNQFFINLIIRDITKSKDLENSLIEAKNEAISLNALKNSFLNNMSHELRTPMVGILGVAEIIHEDVDDPAFKKITGNMIISARRLLNTLNAILDLARFESGLIEVNPVNIEIYNEVANLLEPIQDSIEKKNLYCNIIEPEEEFFITCDRYLFASIISKVANNAVKFTTEGGVTISFKKMLIDNSEFALINIKDTGIGINKDDLAGIFEPFSQISQGIGRNFEGSGIGLTITKIFIEKLGGQITIDSVEGAGTEVSLHFPVTPVNIQKTRSKFRKTLEVEATLAKAKKKVLIVENDWINKQMIKAFLPDYVSADDTDSLELAFTIIELANYDYAILSLNENNYIKEALAGFISKLNLLGIKIVVICDENFVDQVKSIQEFEGKIIISPATRNDFTGLLV